MRALIDQLLTQALARVAETANIAALAAEAPQCERTRDPRHGDFTSNVALRAGKPLGREPRELAAEIVAAVPASDLVAGVEVAGPGFVNFRLTPAAYHRELKALAAAGAAYGSATAGRGQRVLLEFLSANPTGPLHVGHGRHAAYGATLGALLRARGYEIEEEYYVNDAGRQMDILATSVWLRYAEACGAELEFPPNCYQGDYVREIAAGIHREDGRAWLADPTALEERVRAAGDDAEQQLDALIGGVKQMIGEDAFAKFHAAALDSVLADIKDDLSEFGVTPGRWYSERSLTESGAVTHALEELEARGLLYKRDGATWFKSSEFGDEKDRVVVRENGATTYFASDIAYHLDKRERGYDHLLDVLGADHHGYVARVRAGLTALGHPADCLEVRLVQFVVLYRGRVKAQMSTRSGEYITLRELRNEVGNDAARFFYVSRSNDQHLEFDLELAKAQSNDNPVYYVQYAHARVASMLRRMSETGAGAAAPEAADLALLTVPEEHGLMVKLSRYPEVLELAAAQRAPQHLVHYLRELAAEFHSYYNAERILVEERELRDARVALACAVQQVIANGLGLLGVSAPEAM